MSYNNATKAHAPPPSSCVTVLRCRDKFILDPEPLDALFAHKDTAAAEAAVCRALEEIASRLDRLQLARTSGRLELMVEPARRIGGIAGGLGLTGVQQIAGHVADASSSQSGVAVSATMARLERCFDQAISGIWDFRMYR